MDGDASNEINSFDFFKKLSEIMPLSFTSEIIVTSSCPLLYFTFDYFS